MTVGDVQASIRGLSTHQKTNKLIALFSGYDKFMQLASREQALLRKRDQEDETKLEEGIGIAVAAGAHLPKAIQIEWTPFIVDGMEPGRIARDIKAAFLSPKGRTVMAICGLSGIGKSTVVYELSALMPNCVIWFNGELFRALTLLALDQVRDRETPTENEIATLRWSDILSQVEIKGTQIIIHYKETKALDQIRNNILKTPRISRNVPLIAKYTQGQVIAITNQFIKVNPSSSVVIEGRKATLQYIQADFYIELIVRDATSLGARRAAQRILDFIEKENDEKMEVDDRLFLEMPK